MGLNIGGVIIDKVYRDNVAELEKILGENLVFEKELIFEDALESWKEDTHCDVYYSETGTLVLLPFESAGFDFPVKNQKTVSFILSEMSMSFCINYTQNGKVLRTIVEAEGDTHQSEGEPFEFEKEEPDRLGLIYYLFERTLGVDFWDIDPGETCYRYQFKRSVFNRVFNKTEEIPDLSEPEERSDKKPHYNRGEKITEAKKPWWKFW